MPGSPERPDVKAERNPLTLAELIRVSARIYRDLKESDSFPQAVEKTAIIGMDGEGGSALMEGVWRSRSLCLSLHQ